MIVHQFIRLDAIDGTIIIYSVKIQGGSEWTEVMHALLAQFAQNCTNATRILIST